MENNVSNEFLCRMFAAYMGCDAAQFINKEDAVFGPLVTIEPKGFGIKMDDITISYARYEDGGKLILKPLSAITDEDAAEMAKIAGVCIESEEKDEDDIYNHVQPIIDFLRSKSYDAGFQHIPSLITAGLAIIV